MVDPVFSQTEVAPVVECALGGDAKTVQQGAATSILAAVSPLLDKVRGVYCEDCNVATPVSADEPKPNGVRPWAVDPVAAEAL